MNMPHRSSSGDPGPDTLARAVFQCVGPSRIACLTLALAQTKDAGPLVGDASLSLAVVRLRAAHDLLLIGFADMFTEAGIEPDTEVPLLRDSLHQDLAPLEAVIRSGTDDPAGIRARLEAIPDLSLQAPENFELAVNTFLDASMGNLGSQPERRRQERGETMQSALGDVRRSTTSIRMVALNASIEAARAGDAGAGFGVFATEAQKMAGDMAELLEDPSMLLPAD